MYFFCWFACDRRCNDRSYSFGGNLWIGRGDRSGIIYIFSPAVVSLSLFFIKIDSSHCKRFRIALIIDSLREIILSCFTSFTSSDLSLSSFLSLNSEGVNCGSFWFVKCECWDSEKSHADNGDRYFCNIFHGGIFIPGKRPVACYLCLFFSNFWAIFAILSHFFFISESS